MKCQLSIQKKLKDLRVEKGLSLEELAAETGLSKSALGSYETIDHKDISHTAIIALAKFYGVSADYLLGFSENRNERASDISELKLDDDAIADEIFRLRDQKEQSEVDSHHREEAMNRIKELQDFISGQKTDITEFDEALVKKLIEKITSP